MKKNPLVVAVLFLFLVMFAGFVIPQIQLLSIIAMIILMIIGLVFLLVSMWDRKMLVKALKKDSHDK